MRWFIVCLSIVSLWAGDEGSGKKRLFTADDYYSIETPADPHLSPDGKMVAFTVTSIDKKANRKRSVIWLAPVDGSKAPWAFTTGESSSSPRWAPDGHALTFVSARPDPQVAGAPRAEVYSLAFDGGEAVRMTDLKGGASGYQWSPDGTKIACISRVTAAEALPAGKERSDVRHYSSATYKIDGVGFFDDRRAHVFVVDVKSGASKQITFGDEANDSEIQWSPDGKSIAYIAQHTDADMMGGTEIMVVSASGGAARKISDKSSALKGIRWSPDGKRLAYIAAENEISIPKLFVSSASGGASTLVNKDVTYPLEVEWSADGKGLLYTASVKGEHLFFKMDLASGKPTPIISKGSVRAVEINDEKHEMTYIDGDATQAADVYVSDLTGQHRKQVSHVNAKLFAQIALQPTERLNFKASDGLVSKASSPNRPDSSRARRIR